MAGDRINPFRVRGEAYPNIPVFWRFPFAPRKMPLGVASPVVSGNQLFLTSFYDGSLMLRLDQRHPNIEKAWHRVGRNEQETEALQSIISTPLFFDNHIGNWAPKFFEDLEAAEAARLYMPVGLIGKLFLEVESEAFLIAA